MIKEYEKDVHTEHCCQIHGCKYVSWWADKSKCTVKSLEKPQSFPCEFCATEYGDEDEYAKAWELNEMFNRGQRCVLNMLEESLKRQQVEIARQRREYGV